MRRAVLPSLLIGDLTASQGSFRQNRTAMGRMRAVTAEIDELSRLILRCSAGDASALHRVYELQAPRLKGLASRITGSAALAEDVLHDIFILVWQDAHRFDPQRGTASAWLTTLTRFRAMEVIRSRGSSPAGEAADEREDPAPDQLSLAIGGSDARRLHACLQLLSAPARQAVMLAFIEGRTHAQIASLHGLKLGTLKSLIRRSLRQLRGCMEG